LGRKKLEAKGRGQRAESRERGAGFLLSSIGYLILLPVGFYPAG